MNIFRIGVVVMVIFGCSVELNFIWNCADLFMGLLCITNLYAVARLGKYSFLVLDDYISQKNRGIDEPVFDKKIMPTQDGIFAWK